MAQVLEYFNRKKGTKEANKSPILNEEDEKFLERITTEDNQPPIPEKPVVVLDSGEKVEGKDAQKALMDGADAVPLPATPQAEGDLKEGSGNEKPEVEKKGNDYWAYIRNVPNMPMPNISVPNITVPSLPFSKGKAKESAASDPQSAKESAETGDGGPEAEKEADELSSVLDQLNLSAVNNRVFSFSKESQKLMEEFTLILKDIVNGVPTAYDDLEKLLTRQEGQLTKMFGAMPPFLQVLVKNLPTKMTGTLGPEVLAAMSEKPGADAKKMDATIEAQSSSSQDKSTQKKSRIPSLKSLVSQQGAVASMLRSILNFLKLRFPVFMTGTNILMSLAVFLLLFVFWYCHKRGKETRLTKEGEKVDGSESDIEQSVSDPEESSISEKPDDVEPPITINDIPSADEKPSAVVEDLPSVLEQQSLTEAAPPEPEHQKELATPSAEEEK